MKLETSEGERTELREWCGIRIDEWKNGFAPNLTEQTVWAKTDRLLRDIDTLLAEVERLRAEYERAGEQINELETEAEASAAEIGRLRAERRPFSDGLAQNVIDEQVKTIDRLTAKITAAPPLPAEVERVRQRLDDLVEHAPDDDALVFHRGLIAVAASLLSRLPGGWRPISTAPKDGRLIDVWLGDASETDLYFHCVTPGTMRATEWLWRDGKFRPRQGVGPSSPLPIPTHWQPIPEPPNE